MESIEDILSRMTAPISFAVQDSYNHIVQIKNLEKIMTLLVQLFREKITDDASRPLQCELDGPTISLQRLFNGYEELSITQKRLVAEKASRQLADIREILNRHNCVLQDRGHRGPSLISNHEGSVDAVLSAPLRSIRGIGPKIAAILAKKGINTVENLLFYIPRQYEDRREICRISDTVPLKKKQTVIGEIIHSEMRSLGRKRIFEVTVRDGDDVIKAKWFRGRESFLRNTFSLGRRIILTGEIKGTQTDKEILHPDFEILDEDDDDLLHFKRIVPIYSQAEGLSQKTVRRILWQALRDCSHAIREVIPGKIRRKRDLLRKADAIRCIHFPRNDEDIGAYHHHRSDSHRTLVYDDFILFQLCVAIRKSRMQMNQGIAFDVDGEMIERFYRILPFHLTSSQKYAIADIKGDMRATRRMNRLLQGDVGCGKTVVAMAAMIIAIDNGFQAALMAPTEILAEQHYRNLKQWSDQLGIKIQLLTGDRLTALKRNLLTRIENGKINLVIGTHALIEEGVIFKDLGIAVVDEQHRFGVVQRISFRKKGNLPDVLAMTATPIPRTMAMTLYGDLDISIIDESPPGKKIIQTKVFSEAQRKQVYGIVRDEVRKGNQIFIIYPIIEESQNMDLMDATRMSEKLQEEIFPDCCVGLIHGRMKKEEKNRIMNKFVNQQINILVSTTVVEVGIDVPSASLMIIEHAERFGLSQLHQLRGRVGRGNIPGCCILLAQKKKSDQAIKRLKIMEETTDGFRIAEEDLAIRGPGEFLGTRQSGMPEFRVGNIIRDIDLMVAAREDAFAIVAEDPRLEKEEHIALREELIRRWGSCMNPFDK